MNLWERFKNYIFANKETTENDESIWSITIDAAILKKRGIPPYNQARLL